ncbi:MAG: family 1 glycosylhydrolase, partial [Asticcacaulis sp.]
AQPGQWDWALLDDKLEALRENGLTPILDLVHHTALPDAILPDGFAAPDFADRLEDFAARCGERYPWVTHYTLFNEPYLTTQFCGEFGIWFPYHTGGPSFVAMMLNVGRAIMRSAKVLRQAVPGVRFMHPDTCEQHRPLDPADAEAVARANFANQRRFIFDDLLHGLITPQHPLHAYLRDNGASDADLEWFQDHATPIDIRGLDYYRQSEWETVSDGPNRWAENRRGFAAVAADYVERYSLPVMLSETNYFGTSEDRVAWMRDMLREYASLARQYPQVSGFCWFPFVSSTDFQHMLMQYRNDVDPVGIYDLGPDRWDRVPTGLVDLIREMAPAIA